MKWVLSVALLCGSVAPVAAMDLNDKAGMEEVKKKKWNKKKSKSSTKIVVKKPKKDSGPGLVENNLTGENRC